MNGFTRVRSDFMCFIVLERGFRSVHVFHTRKNECILETGVEFFTIFTELEI